MITSTLTLYQVCKLSASGLIHPRLKPWCSVFDRIDYTCAVDSAASCVALGVTFDTDNGTLSWTPGFTDAGTHNFTISGSDGSLSDDETFTITVNNTNRAPVLDAIANETVAENSAITAINAADGGDDLDVDLQDIDYTCAVDSAASCVALGVTFDTDSGDLSWTPGFNDAGTHNFTITGSDGSLSDDETFTITVTNVNRAPVLDAIADETVSENSAITAVNAADGGDDLDVDNDDIDYTCAVDSAASCVALGVTFDTDTGDLSWTPGYDDAGTHNFTITGSDGSLSDDEAFTITVNNTNRAPAIDAISDGSVAENSALSTINANDGGDDNDVDGDSLTYFCTYDILIDGAVPSGTVCSQANLGGTFSFDTSTGELDWTPDYDGYANGDASGRYEFAIVADDGSLTDTEVFIVTVNNTNRAPVLDAISNLSVDEGAAMAQINAADGGDDDDVDGDAITYTCEISGSSCATYGISFNSSTGVLNWTPNYTQSGTYNVVIEGEDPGSLSDTESFTITVNDIAPVVNGITRMDSNPTNATSVQFQIEFSIAVSTLVTGDFSVDSTGVSGTVASVVDQGAGTHWTITVNSITQASGTISVDFVDSNNTVEGNPADYTAGEVYTIDHSRPTISSIARVGSSPSTASSVQYTVTFSENVSNVDAGDFDLYTTDTLTASITNVTGSGSTRTVTVGSFSGSGALRLDFDDTDKDVTDSAGNKVYAIPEYKLIARYPFDGDADDASSAGLDATAYGSPSYTTGHNGQAINFDGSNDYVELPSGFAIPEGSEITVAFWTNLSSSDPTGRYAFTLGSSTNGERIRAEVVSSGDQIRWDYGHTSNNGRESQSFTTMFGGWNHVAVVSAGKNGAFRGIYYNGLVVSSTNSSDGPDSSYTGGQISSSSNEYPAPMDDFVAYTRALSATELDGLYNENYYNSGEEYWINDKTGAPGIASITRENGSYATGTTASFIVEFTEGVNNVDASDFIVGSGWTASGNIASVTSLGGHKYRVIVNSISGNGEIRLDLLDDDDDIRDLGSTSLYPSNANIISFFGLDSTANSSIGGYTGTAYGNTTYVDGYIGDAASFDGTNDYIATNFNYIMDYTWTISAWYNLSSSFTRTEGAFIAQDTENIVGVYDGDWFNDLGSYEYTNVVFTRDTWNYMLTTYNQSTGNVYRYLNGSSVESDYSTSRYETAGWEFGGEGTSNEVEGMLDNVIVWNTDLNSTEASQLWSLQSNSRGDAYEVGSGMPTATPTPTPTPTPQPAVCPNTTANSRCQGGTVSVSEFNYVDNSWCDTQANIYGPGCCGGTWDWSENDQTGSGNRVYRAGGSIVVDNGIDNYPFYEEGHTGANCDVATPTPTPTQGPTATPTPVPASCPNVSNNYSCYSGTLRASTSSGSNSWCDTQAGIWGAGCCQENYYCHDTEGCGTTWSYFQGGSRGYEEPYYEAPWWDSWDAANCN